jgi:ABC-type dipeptide/oligopeptide/nickel transport system ATPase component
MTMICVTHEMGFARQVANRVIFMDQGQIVEQNEPAEFFDNPQHERTKLFLSQIQRVCSAAFFGCLSQQLSMTDYFARVANIGPPRQRGKP